MSSKLNRSKEFIFIYFLFFSISDYFMNFLQISSEQITSQEMTINESFVFIRLGIHYQLD